MKRSLPLRIARVLLLVGFVVSCAKEKPTAPPPGGETATCLSSACHGDSSLVKSISLAGIDKRTEVVPLYVDRTAYGASLHGGAAVSCTSCHTDIVLKNGTHAGVVKEYGGWARFSAVVPVDLNQAIVAGQEGTRNYTTAASMACARSECHGRGAKFSGFAQSAHHTIFKLRAAAVRSVGGHQVGQDYTAGDCNRCHATCATCHFQSTLVRKDASADDISAHWDVLQHSGDGNDPLYKNLTDYAMDWTTNVRRHEFREPSAFASSSEVCRTCHSGYLKPAAAGYYLREGQPDSLKATEVWGDPQYQGLKRPVSAHNGKECAGCHANVHAYPGQTYLWSEGGDVHCTDSGCHTAQASGHPRDVTEFRHPNASCSACHTADLARDVVGQPDGNTHNVWIDPATDQIRPFVVRYGEPLTYSTHIWDAEQGICARRCHYRGNLVDASPGTPDQNRPVKEHD